MPNWRSSGNISTATRGAGRKMRNIPRRGGPLWPLWILKGPRGVDVGTVGSVGDGLTASPNIPGAHGGALVSFLIQCALSALLERKMAGRSVAQLAEGGRVHELRTSVRDFRDRVLVCGEYFPLAKNETPHFPARRFGRALSGSVAGATEVPFLLL